MKKVDQYTLDRISSRMAKQFGKIKRGEEEDYDMLLLPMEGNLLKLHRKQKKLNGHRVLEAIHIVLLKVDGYLRDVDYDFSAVATAENMSLADAFLLAFDPFSREEIMNIAKDNFDLNTTQGLKEYYKVPVICLLRIEQSVEMWTKKWGMYGYFEFFEETMGSLVAHNDEMDFSIHMSDIG